MKKAKLKNNPPEKEKRKLIKHPKEQGALYRYADLFGLGIMILLGIAIYSNSFNCSFHFDDTFNIVNNLSIRNISDVSTWWNASTSRPVAFFTFALNYHFNELDVWGWHLVNLVIHLINAFLVWGLTLLIFETPALKDHPVAKHKKMLALLTGLLFVSHPLATQSVTYIVQRMASMAAMFYLLSLLLYVKARLADQNKTLKYLLLAGAFISALLAFFTKENTFTLPFAIALCELFFFRNKNISINFRDYRVLLFVAAILGGVFIMVQKYSFSIFNPIAPEIANDYRTVTSLNYLLTQFSVIVKYIGLLILPINQNFDYDFPLSNSFFELKTLLNFSLLLALFILAIYLFNRNRIISFGIFWFFLTLSIESSIIPINDLIFEHRTYLPSFGFFLLLSTGLIQLFWDKYRYVAMAIFIGIIASNSYLTFQRNKVWKDEFTLLNDMILKSPEKARGYNNRGNIYCRDGKYELGLSDFDKAIKVQPYYVNSYYNRGNAFYKQKKYDQALQDFNKAIELAPKHTKAYNNRGSVYYNEKKYALALSDFNKVLELEPDNLEAYLNRGYTFDKSGQAEQAIADFDKVIGADPENFSVYDSRANAFLKLNKSAEALSDYNKAIELNPGDPNLYISRGIIFFDQKQYEEAISNFSKAISLKPDFAMAYFNRALSQYYLGEKNAACQDMKQAAGMGNQAAKDAVKKVCN